MQKVARIPATQPVRPASRPADPRDDRSGPQPDESGHESQQPVDEPPALPRSGVLVDDYA